MGLSYSLESNIDCGQRFVTIQLHIACERCIKCLTLTVESSMNLYIKVRVTLSLQVSFVRTKQGPTFSQKCKLTPKVGQLITINSSRPFTSLVNLKLFHFIRTYNYNMSRYYIHTDNRSCGMDMQQASLKAVSFNPRQETSYIVSCISLTINIIWLHIHFIFIYHEIIGEFIKHVPKKNLLHEMQNLLLPIFVLKFGQN